MPNVPYDPTPKLPGPAFVGERFRAPSALGEAMGTGVARARMELGAQQERQGIGIENVGRALGDFGDKIANIAVAQQDLNNETWAKNADVDSITKMGQAASEYDQLEGLNKVQALPAYQAKITALREEALANAPNERARKMLDEQLSRRVAFELLNAGRSAGTAGKEAADKAGELHKQTLIDNFDANSPQAQMDSQSIVGENAEYGRRHGLSLQAVQDLNKLDQSKAVLSSIRNDTDPVEGRKTYEKYKTEMLESYRAEAEKAVFQLEAHAGARDAAQKIMAGQKVVPGGPELKPFDPSKGPGQEEAMLAEGKRVAAAEPYKNNPFFSDNIETYLKQGINTARDGHNDTMRSYEGAIKKFVLGDNPQHKIVNMDAIYNDPNMNRMFHSLDDNYQAAIIKYVSSANKEGVGPSDENIALFKQLLGMARTQPNEFVKLPLIDQNLTHRQLSRLSDEQARIILKKEPDLSVSALTTNTRDIASGAGVAPGPAGSAAAKRWNRYVGGMLEAEADWKQQNPGKTLDSETQRAIAAHELKDVLVHKAEHWWQSDAKMKRFEVPQAEVDKATEVLTKRLGRDPTHTEVNELLDATIPETGK